VRLHAGSRGHRQPSVAIVGCAYAEGGTARSTAKVPASRAGGTAVLRGATPKSPAAGRDGDRRAGLTEAEVLAETAAAEEPTDTAANYLLETERSRPPRVVVAHALVTTAAKTTGRGSSAPKRCHAEESPQHFPSPSIH
jgi:hypothetical protein